MSKIRLSRGQFWARQIRMSSPMSGQVGSSLGLIGSGRDQVCSSWGQYGYGWVGLKSSGL